MENANATTKVDLKQPKVFDDVETLHRELDRLEGTLEPIMGSINPEKIMGGASPSATDLDARMQSIIGRVRGLNERIKL